LQDALKSKVFVRDLHAYIQAFAFDEAMIPTEHALVFDEAQRAWDSAQVERRHKTSRSEPELLLSIGERIPGWSVLVGLVGEGQSIHTGEEGGIEQWRDAVARSALPWKIYAPPRLASVFAVAPFEGDDRLDLTASLRSRRAADLHSWVAALLAERPTVACEVAAHVIDEEYPVYVTRDIDAARRYARQFYVGAPLKRFGLVASSRATNLAPFGIDNSYASTNVRAMDIAKWFNADQADPESCCQLAQPVTEFGCQGLELDLPIVCWGNDLRWNKGHWEIPQRPQRNVIDPRTLRLNAYRVLLTRGRDGVVIFVPPTPDLDDTAQVIRDAGALSLPLTGYSRETPAFFDFLSSRHLGRLVLTCLAFRKKFDVLPREARLHPEVLQGIARVLPEENFRQLAASVALTGTEVEGIEVRGGGRQMTNSEAWDMGEAVFDQADADFVEIARWLGVPEKSRVAGAEESVAGPA
jgi:Uncharacterized conserved protein (DUF2075)